VVNPNTGLFEFAGSFFGIYAPQSVNLDYGNIVINPKLSAAVTDLETYSFFDLFGTDDVSGILSSLTIGEQQFYNVGYDWTFTYTNGVWVSNNVPEPATLVIIALGLAGLGLARRRRSLTLALFLVLPLALPSIASAQVWIDGIDRGSSYSNSGEVANAEVNGIFVNYADPKEIFVDKVVEGKRRGVTANVTLNSGRVTNLGDIGNITVNGGNFYNYGGVYYDPDYIQEPNPYYPGSWVQEEPEYIYNKVERLLVDSGTVGTAILNGGIMLNTGRIENLTYKCGYYKGREEWWFGYQWGEEYRMWYGSIGTLTLAGDSTGIDWGIVENLQFADDGSGILTITAASTNGIDIAFTNAIQADSVDLDYGNIVIDLTGTVSEGAGFSLLDIFGAENVVFDNEENAVIIHFDIADVFGTLASFTIGGQTFYDAGADWSFVYTDRWYGITADGTWVASDVPEPATLAIIGLGLAGLGLARRRRK